MKLNKREEIKNILNESFGEYLYYAHREELKSISKEVLDKATEKIYLILTNRDKEMRERIDKMKLPVEPKYDGNNLEEACQTYGIAAQNWTEVLRLEDGYNRALDDVLNILEEER